MLAGSESNGKVARTEHWADAPVVPLLVLDNRAACETTLGPTVVVVIGGALTLPRARQAVGVTVAGGATDGLWRVDIEEPPECVGLH